MKHICKISFVLVSLYFLPHFAMAENQVGIIDLKKVFDGYWKTKRVKAELDQAELAARKELKDIVDDWNKSKKEYQALLESAKDSAVSADERDKRNKAAEVKFRQLKETEMTAQQVERRATSELDEKSRSNREKILVDIRDAVNASAKSAGYSFVVDVGANSVSGTPVVIYNNGQNDITEPILAKLNAGEPADSSKSAAPGVEKK